MSSSLRVLQDLLHLPGAAHQDDVVEVRTRAFVVAESESVVIHVSRSDFIRSSQKPSFLKLIINVVQSAKAYVDSSKLKGGLVFKNCRLEREHLRS